MAKEKNIVLIVRVNKLHPSLVFETITESVIDCNSGFFRLSHPEDRSACENAHTISIIQPTHFYCFANGLVDRMHLRIFLISGAEKDRHYGDV